MQRGAVVIALLARIARHTQLQPSSRGVPIRRRALAPSRGSTKAPSDGHPAEGTNPTPPLDRRARVAVVIVTYNSAADVLPCLEALSSRWADLDVVVIDNASQDETADLVRASGRARLILNPDNEGFGRAANRAAATCSSDYLLFVNPDAIASPGAVDALLTLSLLNPDAGLYGGRMVDEAGRLDPTSCLANPGLAAALAFGTGASMLRGWPVLDPDSLGGWARDGTREVPVLTAGFLMVEAQLWSHLRGFDEGYFLYGEDVDLCLRARRLGARPMFTDACTYMHQGGASSSSSADRMIGILKGKATLYGDHSMLGTGWLHRGLLLAGAALRASIERWVRPNSQTWRCAWHHREAWRHGWKG